MREIISLNLGQTGVQFGCKLWELFNLEHGVDNEGQLIDSNINGNSSNNSLFRNFYQESSTKPNKFIPRTLFIDTEPDIINSNIKSNVNLKSIFNPSQLISGKEDASNVYSRGRYSCSNEIKEGILDKIRLQTEECDNLESFYLYRSVGGGTGSGLSGWLVESLKDDFESKCDIIEFTLFPSPNVSNSVLEPYNAVLSLGDSIDKIDLSILFDNESQYNYIKRMLNTNSISFDNVNSLMAQVVSNITLSQRFSCSLPQIHINEYITGLNPYPNLHFLMPSISQLAPVSKYGHEPGPLPCDVITKSLINPEHLLLKSNLNGGHMISCNLFFRGPKVASGEIHQSIINIKKQKLINFVEWTPQGFKVGMNSYPLISHNGFASNSKSATMLSNSSAICPTFSTISQKFKLLWMRRSFVHWYISEGSEECEFAVAWEKVQTLINDYKSISKNDIVE